MKYLYSAFGYLMRFCYMIIPNYAIAILLFALIIKIIFFPLGIKQQKNMQKQASLRPKEMAIRKRYAGRTDKMTQQKMQQDIMELYQKENYSMFGGCLPTLIQFPIIIALYNVIRNPLTYLMRLGDYVAPIKEKILELNADAKILAEIDMFQYLHADFAAYKGLFPEGFTENDLPSFTAFKIFDLSQTPSLSDKSWLLLIPVITFVVAYFSMKLTRKLSYQAPQSDLSGNAAVSMKIMDFTMPLLSVWITFTVPAIVGLYWIYQNILGTVQQFILSKIYKIPVFTDEDYKKAEKELNGSLKGNKAKNKAKVKSLHNDDDEEGETDKTDEKKSEKKNDAPPLKEDRNGKAPELKDDTKTKKVRSLHHIDDDNEDY